MNLKSLSSGAFLLSTGTFLSYLFGAIRDPIFAWVYGANAETDAYLNAFLLGDVLLMAFISSALLGLANPLFTREREISEKRGNSVFGNFFGVLNGIFLAVLLFAFFFTPQILSVIFPHTFEKTAETFVILTRCVLVANFLFALSNFMGTFLMTFGHFFSTAISPILYNIGIITGVLFFGQEYGIFAAGGGVIFGAVLHFSARVIEYFWQKERFSPSFSLKDSVLQELLSSMVLKAMSVTALPLLMALFANISTEQDEGMFTIFSYVRNLESAPVAIFGIAFATAVFPLLSSHSAKGEKDHFSQKFWNTAGKILFWSIPSTVGVFFVGGEFLRILYGFEKNSLHAEWISSFIILLSISIPFEALYHLFSRSFHAKGDASTPLYANLLFLLSGGVSAVLIAPYSPLLALGIGYGIGFMVQTAFFCIQASSLLLKKPNEHFWRTFLKSIFPSIFMGIFLFFMPHEGIKDLFISIAGGGILFLAGRKGMERVFWKA